MGHRADKARASVGLIDNKKKHGGRLGRSVGRFACRKWKKRRIVYVYHFVSSSNAGFKAGRKIRKIKDTGILTF